MNAAAEVTTDDGDKVNHGWSQLDIAKHSTNTFVSSLGDDDYVSVVVYSDGARVLLDWTQTTADGREKAIAAIHSMRPERSTNLMAGITTGARPVRPPLLPAPKASAIRLRLPPVSLRAPATRYDVCGAHARVVPLHPQVSASSTASPSPTPPSPSTHSI